MTTKTVLPTTTFTTPMPKVTPPRLPTPKPEEEWFRKVVEAVWRDGNGTQSDQEDDYVEERVTDILDRIKTGRRIRD